MPDSDSRVGQFELIPLAKPDAFREVLDQLTQFISASGLTEGDRLPPERELGERLAVSRVLVREALRTLQGMGIIEVRGNKGRFVLDQGANLLTRAIKAQFGTGLSLLNDLVDVRVAIEQRVVELVGGRPDADLSAARVAIEAAEREFVAAGASAGARAEGGLDPRFEAALGRQSGNPLLHAMQRSIHQLWIEACLDCGLAAGDRRQLHQEHRAILAALEGGDVAKASQLMSEHLNRRVDGSATTKAPFPGVPSLSQGRSTSPRKKPKGTRTTR